LFFLIVKGLDILLGIPSRSGFTETSKVSFTLKPGRADVLSLAYLHYWFEMTHGKQICSTVADGGGSGTSGARLKKSVRVVLSS
jgi:hypothetical protein